MKIFKKKVNLSLTIALFLRQLVRTGIVDTTCCVNEPEKIALKRQKMISFTVKMRLRKQKRGKNEG